ncbi:MAG: hypothetical protein NZ706_01305 [Candidatus Caldatribacterium sp.]|nr:hypothetical protein [Candidatus Caldatribacterium sp.]MDW8081572.1 hypothetical protein [Candidatus Calescibacterium sp.]
MKGWQMKDLKDLAAKAGGRVLVCGSSNEAFEKAKDLGANIRLYKVRGEESYYLALPDRGEENTRILKEMNEKTALEFEEIQA